MLNIWFEFQVENNKSMYPFDVKYFLSFIEVFKLLSTVHANLNYLISK